jgi:2-phosphoglycolate phosphatase
LIPRFPVYIFDVDGTLVDSAADISAAILQTLAASGRNDVTEAHLRRYIGRHLLDMYLDLGFEADAIEPMIAHYRRVYPELKHARTSVFPGVAAMLERLPGRKSTATTKGTPMTRAVLEQFELLRHFDHVQGTDGFPAKPEPDVILRSIQALGAAPAECLLVGDSAADMEAGKRAGVRTCAVRWGYGDAGEMARWSPDYWIEEPRELLHQ